MQGAKPWQIVIIVAAVLAVVAVSVYSCKNSDDLGLAKEIPMVDVVTGDLFIVKVPKKGSMAIPMRHPETDRETLILAGPAENGFCPISERYISGLDLKGLEQDKLALDSKTKTVKVSDKAPRTITGR
jgi:hypothetical protein